MRPHNRGRAWLAGAMGGLLALALWLVPPVATSDSPVATLELHACDLGGVSARCGTLPVYEDRTSGIGRMVELRVVVVPAGSGRSAPDPVFYLAGGPGGVATEDIRGALSQLTLTNHERDLVFVDQRGTGGSNELVCPYPATASREEYVDELATCLAELPGDPRAYTTAWAMDDLDEVRAALGYHTINLYGGSYGATAAQVYLQRYPQRVRTATLIAGPPLDLPMFEWWPWTSQRALDRLFARCAADPRCRAAYPDPRGDLEELALRLDEGPVQLPLTDRHSGEPVLLTRELLGPLVHLQLTGTAEAARLPRWLHAASQNDWRTVVDLLDWLWDSDAPSWQVMNLTILCHEPWARLRRAETEALAVGSYLSYADIRALTATEEVCAVVPQPPPAAGYDLPKVVAGVPVLAISGEADPGDPPELLAGLARHYPDSRLLVAVNQGHWFASDRGCLAATVAQFVASASVDAVTPDCLASVPAPRFSVG